MLTEILIAALFLAVIKSQQPATINVSRNWQIPENTKIGTIVKTVDAKGDNKNGENTIVYSLSLEDPFHPNQENPFWIHPHSGYVYLNKSLEGQATSEPFILTIAADDGQYTVKNQVRVSIVGVNGNTRHTFVPNRNTFPKLPDISSIPAIHNFPTNIVTKIEPVQNKTYVETTSSITNATSKTDKIPVTTDLVPPETPAIFPILIAVLVIFLIAGMIAVIIFRKQICRHFPFGRKFKKSKVDKAKKSNQSINVITLSDESSRNSMSMQHWEGPQSVGNRYTPWATAPHDGVYSSSSFSYLGGEIKVHGKYDRWEFPRHRLKVFNILGEGAFGQVWRCEANDIDGIDGISTVAVKTLKENANESEKKDLVSELQVMKSLEPHVNVVRLLGCCTEKDPTFVIIEYVALGKLQTLLRNSRVEKNYSSTNVKSKTLTSHDLINFMYQVSSGMCYLSSRGIIHRDLAARNVLIDEDYICKIADFGFARDIENTAVYERKTGGRQPIRWMAIESLFDNIFSVKSDVWSFGILMWEIATLGATPYPGMGAAEVMKRIKDGYRLEKPEHTTREIYNYMYYCWDADSANRPDFSEIRQNLDNMLATSTDYIELERFPEHDYYNILQNISGEKL